MLIVNCDDWGRSREETDAALACFERKAVTSVTAMMFMKDSERAARVAGEAGVAVGLHLNLSEPFTGEAVSSRLGESHERVCRFLRTSKFAHLIYHPLLGKDFKYVVEAQWAEFQELYGRDPSHLDGHQHQHLCANVLTGGLIERGTKVRGTFTFFPGEKSRVKRAYRKLLGSRLKRRFRVTDYFFDLSQCLANLDRLRRILALAADHEVELMTHPVRDDERSFLCSDEYAQMLAGVPTGNYDSI